MDLAELSFIDCAGLAALASARREARKAGGDLLLAAAAQPVARLLSLTGELPVFASVSEAAREDPQALAAVGRTDTTQFLGAVSPAHYTRPA